MLGLNVYEGEVVTLRAGRSRVRVKAVRGQDGHLQFVIDAFGGVAVQRTREGKWASALLTASGASARVFTLKRNRQYLRLGFDGSPDFVVERAPVGPVAGRKDAAPLPLSPPLQAVGPSGEGEPFQVPPPTPSLL